MSYTQMEELESLPNTGFFVLTVAPNNKLCVQSVDMITPKQVHPSVAHLTDYFRALDAFSEEHCVPFLSLLPAGHIINTICSCIEAIGHTGAAVTQPLMTFADPMRKYDAELEDITTTPMAYALGAASTEIPNGFPVYITTAPIPHSAAASLCDGEFLATVVAHSGCFYHAYKDNFHQAPAIQITDFGENS